MILEEKIWKNFFQKNAQKCFKPLSVFQKKLAENPIHRMFFAADCGKKLDIFNIRLRLKKIICGIKQKYFFQKGIKPSCFTRLFYIIMSCVLMSRVLMSSVLMSCVLMSSV